MARATNIEVGKLSKTRRRVWDLLTSKKFDMKAASLLAGRGETYFRDYFGRGHPKELPETVREKLGKALSVEPDYFRDKWRGGDAQELSVRNGTNARKALARGSGDALSSGYAETARIDEIDIRAGLGGGGLVEAENVTDGSGYTMSKDAVKARWELPRAYLRELRVSEQGLYLFRAVGDSMTRPDGGGIHSGDVLMADTEDKRPSPPGIFAVDDGFGVIVKRLEFVAYSEPPRMSIRSDNPAHASYELPAEEVRVIGRCVWYGRGL